jgi:YidC/Oxa1 family membrane protein insertase
LQDFEENLLKLAVRIPLVSVMLVMLGMMLSGCGQAPQGIPPITLEHARQLEVTDPKKAVVEYNAVRSEFDGKDKEMAATALVRAAQFASDPTLYVQGQVSKEVLAANTAESRQKIEDIRTEGDMAARMALKQLEQHYADTKVYQTTNVPVLLTQVEQSIDTRNSKTLSYKIVDSLVRLTGSFPVFSYWFALFLIAVFIKAVTFPLLLKTYKSQREMQRIQPILKSIQAKYKEKPDPAAMQSETMAAYKEHGVNPFASCLPSLVQIPVFMLMFRLIQAYEIHFAHGYFLWMNPTTAALPWAKQLGIAPNLAQLDVPILILYAASMYISMKLAPSPDPQMAAQQRQMSVMMTGMMIYWFWVTKWSSAFLLYYLVQNILSTWQQYVYIYKPNKLNAANNPPVAPTASRGPVAPKSSPGVRDVTFVEEKAGEGAYRNGGATPSNRPRPKRKARR